MITVYGWKIAYDENILKDFKIAQQKQLIRQLEVQKDVDQNTISKLEELQKKTEEHTQVLEDRLNDISEAPESDDGPVAPVLRRTIDSL
jgi:bacterioferritin (cytochrome b1)